MYQFVLKSDILPIILKEYDSETYQLQCEKVFLVCYLIYHSDSESLKYIFQHVTIDQLVEHLLIDDNEMIGRLLVALVHATEIVSFTPNDFSEQIEALNDPSLIERLDEIVDMNIAPLVSCAHILIDNIHKLPSDY